MNFLVPSISTTLLGILFLFLVYMYLFRTYKYRYLLIWSSSWLLYSIRFMLELTEIFIKTGFMMVPVTMVTTVSGFLLLCGTFSFIERKIPLYWIAAVAIAILWSPVAWYAGASFTVVTAPGFTVLAAIYIITGIQIIKNSPAKKDAAMITGICFIIWGLHKADYPVMRNIEWFAPWGFFIGLTMSFGVAIGMILIFFEKLQSKLSESEKFYHDLFDVTGEAIFIHDAETGKILDVNKRMTEMYGFTMNEALSCSVGDISDNSTGFCQTEAMKKIDRAVNEGPQLFSWHNRRKDGSTFWGDVSLVRTKLNSRDVVLATVRDTSGKEEAEMKLSNSTVRFQNILESMPLVAVNLNSEGRIVYANSFFSKITGWNTDELSGIDWFEKIVPHFPELKQFFTNTCLSAGSDLPTYNENTILTKSGEKRLIRWSNTLNYDTNGNVEGITAIGEDVTEKIRMIDIIKERETLYRSVIEASVDGFWITDAGGNILEVNDSYCRLSGYSKDELMGMNISDIETSEDPEEIKDHISRLMENGSDIFETRHRKKDGTIWYAEVNACFHDISGGRFFVFTRDIYKRKRSEIMLRIRSELSELADRDMTQELMTLALDHAELLTGSSIGFFHFVDDDQIHINLQTWSTNTLKNMCKADGKGFHYPIGDAGVWVDCVYKKAPVIHNDYASLPHRKGLPEGHAPVVRELVVPVIRNGLVAGILGVGNKTSDYTHDDVDATETLASIAMDVIALKKSEDSLRNSEANLRLAQQIALLCSWEFNHATEKMIWSNDVFELLETDQEKCPFSIRSFLNYVHPEDVEFMKSFSRCIDNGNTPRDITVRIITNKGRTKWVRIAGRTETDSSEKPVRTIGTIQDVTELKKAEIERHELENQMLQVQKLESLGVLAGGMAHDFNNILTAILGHSEIATITIDSENPANQSLMEISNAAKRAADICHQMLAYAGRGRFVVEPVFLDSLIIEMVDLLKTSVSKKAALNVITDTQTPPVNADATQIRQVVMNLITNASEAIGDSSGEITVKTGITGRIKAGHDETFYGGGNLMDGSYVYIEVSDTGCGMDSDTVSRIFEPFFTTKFTGRGLGMAAILGIVKSHNGAISIKSQPGKGTVFRLYFPPCEMAEKNTDVQKLKDKKNGVEGRRVLLADDESAITAIGTKILEKMGLEVITASDGKEAVRVFSENIGRLDLAIIDLTMPILDGAEVFDEIRKIAPGFPVIIISGYTEYEISSRFAEKNVSGFIKKPFSTREMRGKIEDVINSSSLLIQ